MHEGFFGWSLENVGKGIVETKYIIESITDEKIWNKFLRTENLELYTKKEYDNIENALEYYLCWYVNDSCYDIKMWVNGEVVLEQMIEPKSTCKSVMRHSIDREMKDRMKQAESKAEELERSNELYKGFLKAMGKQFEEMFEEYCKNETRK